MAGDANIVGAPEYVSEEVQITPVAAVPVQLGTDFSVAANEPVIETPAVINAPLMGEQFAVATAPQEPVPAITHPGVDGPITFQAEATPIEPIEPVVAFNNVAPQQPGTIVTAEMTNDAGITTVITGTDVGYNAENASLNLQSSPVCDLFDVGVAAIENTFTNTHDVAAMEAFQPVPQVPDQQPPVKKDWDTTYSINDGPTLNA